MILRGDCIDRMAEMDADSIDAIVCDPPYGLEFMGKEWDRLDGGEDVRQPFRGEVQTPDNPYGRTPVRYGYDAVPVRMQEWHHAWATEAIRILKPGGHLLAFGGTRTYHRLACAVEDAGFEIRDSLIWLYGSGFPKSLDVSKAIDKAAGAEREVVGDKLDRPGYHLSEPGKVDGVLGNGHGLHVDPDARLAAAQITAPATPEATQWQGWGTALKPAHEPIVVARKPLVGTVAANVLEHGTGALNVDGCRVGTDDETGRPTKRLPNGAEVAAASSWERQDREPMATEGHPAGRWPANVALSHLPGCEQVGTRRVKSSDARKADGTKSAEMGETWSEGSGLHPERSTSPPTYNNPDGTETIPAYSCAPGCPVAELDRQSGEVPSTGTPDRPATYARPGHAESTLYGDGMGAVQGPLYSDTGGASRFFYVAKASRAERNAGLGGFEDGQRPLGISQWEGQTNGSGDQMGPSAPQKNVHPTVKPIALMRWLVRLVTPPGGTVLDPFTGSGTTGAAAVLEGFDFIGIEREDEYADIAEARVAFWSQFPGADVDAVLVSDARAREIEATGQLGLLTITEEE